MKQNIALFAVFMALALALPAHAQDSQCLSSVSGTASADTVTTGTDFTISVTPASSESSCTVSTLSLSGAPTSYTISDPPSSQSNQYSGFTAGTTKTFTVSTGAAGIYQFTPTATTSAGSISGTAVIVAAVDPSTLTVTPSPSSAQINLTQAFTFSVTITGSESASVTTSYSLSVPSGLTASGDSTSSSALSVAANGSSSLSWTINHTSCFTGAKTVTFALGSNSNAASASVTGNTTCDTGSTGSGGGGTTGGGGGGGATASSSATVRISFLKAGNTTAITTGLKTSTTTVKRIEVSAAKNVFSVQLTVEKSSSRPATAKTDPPATNVYNYVIISRENITDADVSGAKIDFEVPKSWLTSNSLEPENVSLYRYSKEANIWDKLTTNVLSQDDTTVTYRAESPGLSVFAIGATGSKTAPAPEAQPDQTAGETGATGGEAAGQPAQEGQEAAPAPPPAGDFVGTIMVAAVLVIIIVLGAGYFALKKPKSRYEYQKKYTQKDK